MQTCFLGGKGSGTAKKVYKTDHFFLEPIVPFLSFSNSREPNLESRFLLKNHQKPFLREIRIGFAQSSENSGAQKLVRDCDSVGDPGFGDGDVLNMCLLVW